MTSQSATQVPPIKLKFSLNSKPGPSTSVPAATPAPVVISRKGKAKAVISDGDHTQGSPSFVLKVLGANPDAVIETSEKPSQDTSSKPVIKLYPPSHRPTTPLRAPFIAKDGAPEAGSSTVRSPSPIAEPGRHTVSTVYPSPRASTPAINPSSSSEAALETTPIPTRPITTTPEASTALRTPKTGRKSTGRAKGSKVNPKTRPSAIPPRLLSTDPSTPRSLPAPSLPDESLAPSEGTVVKAELGAEDDTGPDPISLPLLPSAAQVSTPKDDGEEFDTPVTGKGKGGGRWMRLRRPLRELLGRIMVELRRKDEVRLSFASAYRSAARWHPLLREVGTADIYFLVCPVWRPWYVCLFMPMCAADQMLQST